MLMNKKIRIIKKGNISVLAVDPNSDSSKLTKPFVGKWRITEMDEWDQDYVDMDVPGYIQIDSDGTGEFQFGLVVGNLEGRPLLCDDVQHFEFSWSGQDENDPASGQGWAAIEDGELVGCIGVHSDESGFRAVRSS
jgi:hypothetical protein